MYTEFNFFLNWTLCYFFSLLYCVLYFVVYQQWLIKLNILHLCFDGYELHEHFQKYTGDIAVVNME